MKTTVTSDYLEVKLTGFPNLTDSSPVKEDVYTGTVLGIGYDAQIKLGDLTGRSIIFSKVHKLTVSSAEYHYYVHKNAVLSIIE